MCPRLLLEISGRAGSAGSVKGQFLWWNFPIWVVSHYHARGDEVYAGETVCTPISTVRLVYMGPNRMNSFFFLSAGKKISGAEEETPLIKSLPCKGETCIWIPMYWMWSMWPSTPELRGRRVEANRCLKLIGWPALPNQWASRSVSSSVWKNKSRQN